MRILAGVLAGQNFTAELVGDESLSSRPMRRIIEPLELMGARINSNDGKPPLKITGSGQLSPITYKLPVASAQVKSAILFASLFANGRTTVIEKSPSRDHTERLFNGFGVPVTTNDDLSITIDGPARFTGGTITIPGDISSAAYFIAAAMLLPNSELTIEAIGLNPTRAAFLSVFNSWGAEISTTDLRSEHNEPVGTINVSGGLRSAAARRRPDVVWLDDSITDRRTTVARRRRHASSRRHSDPRRRRVATQRKRPPASHRQQPACNGSRG